MQSRRTVLKTVAGASLMSAASLGRVLGANDRVRVGLIGHGLIGTRHLLDFKAQPDVEIVAVSELSEERLEAAATAAGTSPARYKDFRKILERPDVDAVVVSTPDHWHALMTILACAAGKDVYVEKPLTLVLREGEWMQQAAGAHKRVVQVGTQQRSGKHYKRCAELVRDGQIGDVRSVRMASYRNILPGFTKPVGDRLSPADWDMWLGPAKKRPFNPNRFHFTFRWYWDYSGGLMTDWGAHMIDIANWAMDIKAPSSAVSTGGKFGYPDDAMETPDTQQVLWAFPSFTMIWEHALGVGRGPEAREHGVLFHGENGVLVVDRGGWEVYPETDRIDKKNRIFKAPGVPRQSVSNPDYHLTHVQNFIDCVRSRKRAL
jgi:predicted dehydrogenase